MNATLATLLAAVASAAVTVAAEAAPQPSPSAQGSAIVVQDQASLRAGHVGAQFWSVWIPVTTTGPAAVRTTIEQIEADSDRDRWFTAEQALAMGLDPTKLLPWADPARDILRDISYTIDPPDGDEQ